MPGYNVLRPSRPQSTSYSCYTRGSLILPGPHKGLIRIVRSIQT